MNIENSRESKKKKNELELCQEFQKQDIYGQLTLKINNKDSLKEFNWPIIKDSNNYEYSYNKHSSEIVYYYCRSYRKGCIDQ